MTQLFTLIVASALTINTVSALAQDSEILLDQLVQRGVLSAKDGDQIREKINRQNASSSAHKIQLNHSVTELKLYGDLRLRYQYDNVDPQVNPAPIGGSPVGAQRSRFRFRLRLNADFKLTEHIFGGVELASNEASDSYNQTFENAFNRYPIYISKAYVGWSNDWLTLTGGKFSNPFYTTELMWDPDINPNGIVEVIAFHKLVADRAPAGFSKDGKTAMPVEKAPPWELTLVAGQLIFDDNLEGGGTDPATRDNDLTTDTFLFETQLIGSYQFHNGVKFTLAPAWMVYNAGTISGANNTKPFNDSAFVSGASRNINLLLAPGDVAFKLGGVKTKLYWDFSYNFDGSGRVNDTYLLKAPNALDPSGDYARHSSADDFSYLVGIQSGQNQKRGDAHF